MVYAADINVGLDMSNTGTREDLWKKVKSCNLMNTPLPWYPEQDGYGVCSIKQGKQLSGNMSIHVSLCLQERMFYWSTKTILGSEFMAIKVSLTWDSKIIILLYNVFAGCFVIHQSADTILHLGHVIPLYCVASNHSLSYSYECSNLSGKVGLKSPVSKPRVYKCTVHAGGQTCLSKSIHVRADSQKGKVYVYEWVQCSPQKFCKGEGLIKFVCPTPTP